jgi:hypothetical protein
VLIYCDLCECCENGILRDLVGVSKAPEVGTGRQV